MRRITLAIGFAAALATVRCDGTSTGNPRGPLVSFTPSDCRLDQGQPPAETSTTSVEPRPGGAPSISATRQAITEDGGAGAALDSNEQDFLWLNCIAWDLRDDSTLDLRFWNVEGGCSADWVGANVRFDGNTLDLGAEEQGCQIARCGACVYDFSFEVRDVPAGDLPVKLHNTDENGKACTDGVFGATFTLPTSTEPSGVRCNPIHSVGFVTPVCVRHGACGDTVSTPAGIESCPACPNGDLCAPIADGDRDECLKPCSTDADCENPAMGCKNGGCTVVSTW